MAEIQHPHPAAPVSPVAASATPVEETRDQIRARNEHLGALYAEGIIKGDNIKPDDLSKLNPDEIRAVSLGQQVHYEIERTHPDLIRDTKTLASIASIFPGIGTLTGAGMDVAATAAQLGKDIKEGASAGDALKHLGIGVAGTAMDFVPGGVGVALKGVFAVRNNLLNGGACRLYQDIRHGVTGHPIKDCTDHTEEMIQEAANMAKNLTSGPSDVARTDGKPDTLPSQSPALNVNNAQGVPAANR